MLVEGKRGGEGRGKGREHAGTKSGKRRKDEEEEVREGAELMCVRASSILFYHSLPSPLLLPLFVS